MAHISFNADVKIRVVFPYVTKSLKGDDRSRLNASGSFTYTPKPQVDAAQSVLEEPATSQTPTIKERSTKLQAGLGDLLAEIEKIRKAMAKRAKGIVFEYDPTQSRNEAYSDAEETIFGFASGTITYDMFEQILVMEEKIDRWIAHQSIANGGTLNGI